MEIVIEMEMQLPNWSLLALALAVAVAQPGAAWIYDALRQLPI